MKDFLSKKGILRFNLIFIFIFLNIWEFLLSRELFNGMIIGLVMFGPLAFLWFLKTIRAYMLVTLISIFELTALTIFVLEGFEFGGAAATFKSLFWVPYLAMALANTIVGLRIYAGLKATNAEK